MDHLTNLKLFARVIEAGSLSAAARQLGVSTSTVSKSIQVLEEGLGARLLNRTTRKVRPTEAGQVFYQRCVHILSDLDEAEAIARDTHSVPRGVLRLNVCAFVTHDVPPLLSKFIHLFPAVSFELVMTDRLSDLVGNGFDLSIWAGPLFDSSAIARRVGFQHLIWCASPDYLATNETPKRPQDLQSHNCVLYANQDLRPPWKIIADDLAGKIKVRANCTDALRAVALSGAGIALLPETSVTDELATGRLIRLLREYEPYAMPIYVVSPPGRHLSVKVRSFIDFLAEHYAERASSTSGQAAQLKFVANG
jgi:DNA-binding transcriptional LysR family regulator